MLKKELSNSKSERPLLIKIVKDEIIEVTIVKMDKSTNAILEKYYTNWDINFIFSNKV